MLTKKLASLALAVIVTSTVTQAINAENVHAETASPAKNIVRIQGDNRFKTSKAIAEEVSKDTSLDNVVLASGYDFPDGLSGSTFAKKLNAPLLMAGNLSDSKEALEYIASHLRQNGNVYILGGTGVVGKDTEDDLTQKGYKVIRVYGQNRFETNNSIIDNLNPEEGTPVFISNAYGFADALSASSIAAIKGYPMLLTNSDRLSNLIGAQLSKIKPSKVYIVGGTGVVSTNVESEIKNILPSAEIVRLAGADRYQTSMNVYKYFNLDTKSIILASGKDFPDALSGSQLAAKFNASMVLSDEDNLGTQQDEYNKKGIENFYLLGGGGALSGNVEQAICFDKDTEMENIKVIYNKEAQAVRLKDIDELMSTVDESSPYYNQTKELYEDLFQFCSENDLDIIPTFDSIEFVSISYKEATVKAVETDALTDNNEQTTEYEKVTTLSTFKKINGQWKACGTTITQ